VAHQFSPALVISAAATQTGSARIAACDPGAGTPVWDVEYSGCTPLSLTAGNARIFVAVQTAAGAGRLLVLHPEDGSLLQGLDGPLPRSEAALAADRLLLARQSGGTLSLDAFREDATLPLTWNGAAGIKALTTVGTDSADVYWDSASAPAGLVVRYAVFYRALTVPNPDVPPAFSAPYTGTTVIPGLSAADGAVGYRLSLDPGVRYSVGVRAYYGRWNENAVTDGNVNWLAATASWQRQPPLDLGAPPPPGGTQLPAGEAYQLQGILDSTGGVHLLYNDEADARLTHVYQDAGGAWQVEAAGIGTYHAADFEPRWSGGKLQVAYAWADHISLLTRNGPDTWSNQLFTSNAFTNPQVTLALSEPPPPLGQGAIAYTEFLSGSFPLEAGEANLIRTDQLGIWQLFITIDQETYAGRDLSAALDPASKFYCAVQRGYTYAPNRITPQNGELYFVQDDGAGGYLDAELDKGSNPRSDGSDKDSSDVGKRVQLALDSAGRPRLAYLDLNASTTDPRGELKYASFDGSAWQIEVVYNFDLSYQLFRGMQFTWGELSFGLTPSGSPQGADLPVIGMLGRRSAADTVGTPHQAYPLVWTGLTGGGWRAEQLDDALDVYPNDREPCELLLTPTAWHYFVCTTRDVNDPGAKRIAYYRRGL
jgi:hypothetical protein